MISNVCLTIFGWRIPAAVKGDSDSQLSFAVNSVAALRAKETNPATSSAFSASATVQRGNLGIHFNGSRQNLAAEKHVPLIGGQRTEV